jgi:hypothetical protein
MNEHERKVLFAKLNAELREFQERERLYTIKKEELVAFEQKCR